MGRQLADDLVELVGARQLRHLEHAQRLDEARHLEQLRERRRAA